MCAESKLKTILSIVFIIFSFLAKPAFSCSEEAQDLYWTYDKMVWNTNSIVLAKVSSVEPVILGRETLYNRVGLDVIEVLKGSNEPKTISLKGIPFTNNQTDYTKHHDLAFWGKTREGNARYWPDCKTYGHYELGNIYLIYSEITHTKGYERIIDLENDKWLKLTRYIINSK